MSVLALKLSQLNQSQREGLPFSIQHLNCSFKVPLWSSSVYTMRCVSVCVQGEWFRVPCGGPSASVQSVGSEALRRYLKAKEHEDRDVEFSMRRCRGGELLQPEDRAEDVLEDNDFVQLCMLL